MSDDLDPRLGPLRGVVQSAWSPSRAGAVLARVQRKQGTRKRLQKLAGAAALVMLFLVPMWLLRRPPHATAPPAVTVALRLPDGSVVTALSADADIKESPPRPDRTTLQLRHGSAQFRVARDPRRVFRVEVGRAAVEVLGTQFSITRRGELAEVRVSEGRVRVLWDQYQTELSAGEYGTFPKESAPVSVAPPETPSVPPAPPAGSVAPAPEAPEPAAAEPSLPAYSKPTPSPSGVGPSHRANASLPRSQQPPVSWRALAQDGEFEKAYALVNTRDLTAASDDPGDLLLLADIARLSRHPSAAVAPLEKILRQHRSDPRAALCGFTLGRILLDDLGKPREAAAAFRDAQTLDQDFALMEDAIAREVKALWQAGDTAAARDRALEYLRRFPSGSQARAVRRFGGLE